MVRNQLYKLEIWGYDFQGIKKKNKPHFKTKETLESSPMEEYYSAVKGDPLLTHTIMASSEVCISVTPFTWHCRKR